MPTATEKRKAPKKVTAKKVKVAKAEQSPVEKTTELSERVLKQVEHGQKRAIEAVRDFMESVDKALPPHGKNPSRRQDVIDSALEMSEKLVDTQYDFLQSVVHSAGRDARGDEQQEKVGEAPTQLPSRISTVLDGYWAGSMSRGSASPAWAVPSKPGQPMGHSPCQSSASQREGSPPSRPEASE